MPHAAAIPRLVPRYYIGPHDRLTIDRLEYTHAETNEIGHVLCRADNPKLVETVTHEAFLALVNAPNFRLDRNWYSAEKAMVRMHAGVAAMRDLPDDEQAKILRKKRWCEAFLKLEATDPAVSRTDVKMKAAIATIAPTIADVGAGKPPHPKRLREWINDLIAAGGDPLILRDGHWRCGNRTSRFTPAEYALLVKHAWGFAKRTKPDKAAVYRAMEAEFDLVNTERRKLNLKPLKLPGPDRLSEEIDQLPQFKVFAARHGPDAARAKYMPVLDGVDAVRALQRVEMDMWSVQLHVLCIDAGIWEALSDEMRAAVERSRKVICVAIDCASRCILAMRFADEKRNSEQTQVALDTLEMALCDKKDFADANGAVTPWEMSGTHEELATDNGSAFIAAAFKCAAHDAEIGDLAPPAKLPHLRGTIERAFRTAHTQLVALFEGRSFENVVAKGDYPAEERASITVDELAWALVRYVVDIYHNSEHDGLGGETPRAAWLRLSKAFPVMPPPDVHKRRAAFGIELARIVTPRGVRILGIHYQAPELQEFLRQYGFGTKVCVRYDGADLGHISVRLGDAWLTVAAPDDTFHGLDAATWIATTNELRRRHVDLARLTKPIVLEAIRAIRRLSEHAAKRANIATVKMAAEEIDREERKLSIGFDYVHPEAHADDISNDVGGPDGTNVFYTSTLKVGQPAAPPSAAEAPSDRSASSPIADEPSSAPSPDPKRRHPKPPRRWTFKE